MRRRWSLGVRQRCGEDVQFGVDGHGVGAFLASLDLVRLDLQLSDLRQLHAAEVNDEASELVRPNLPGPWPQVRLRGGLVRLNAVAFEVESAPRLRDGKSAKFEPALCLVVQRLFLGAAERELVASAPNVQVQPPPP